MYNNTSALLSNFSTKSWSLDARKMAKCFTLYVPFEKGIKINSVIIGVRSSLFPKRIRPQMVGKSLLVCMFISINPNNLPDHLHQENIFGQNEQPIQVSEYLPIYLMWRCLKEDKRPIFRAEMIQCMIRGKWIN